MSAPQDRKIVDAKAPARPSVTNLNVGKAELSFKTKRGDWQRLEDSYDDEFTDKEIMHVPWNIEDLRLTTDGIYVSQYDKWVCDLLCIGTYISTRAVTVSTLLILHPL